MKFTKPLNEKSRTRRGLSLVEILICSTIAVLMLMATGIAFRSSVMAFRDSTDRNVLLGNGRAVIRQIVDEIRQGDAHGPINDTTVPNASTLFASGLVTENSGIQILKKQPDMNDPGIVRGNFSTWVLIVWYYDAPTKTIRRSRTVNSVTTSEVIANYVQEFKVRMEPARSAANVAAGNTSFDLLLRAVVAISLQDVDASGKTALSTGSGLVTTRMVDAAVPRRSFAGL